SRCQASTTKPRACRMSEGSSAMAMNLRGSMALIVARRRASGGGQVGRRTAWLECAGLMRHAGAFEEQVRPRRQHMARRITTMLATCAIVGALLVWVPILEPARRHRAFCEATEAELMSLTKKRPPNLTRIQWQNVVAWTLNGYANILTFKS